jgi:hypothetical protein
MPFTKGPLIVRVPPVNDNAAAHGIDLANGIRRGAVILPQRYLALMVTPPLPRLSSLA